MEGIMTGSSDCEFELIFDVVAKSAIVRRGENVIWLQGPFRNYPDAMQAARMRVREADSRPSNRR
jgi:hypothetical protein